jgi:hypothetical protein
MTKLLKFASKPPVILLVALIWLTVGILNFDENIVMSVFSFGISAFYFWFALQRFEEERNDRS